MAKLRSYKRVITSDFGKDSQPLVEKLGGILNDSFSEVYSALSGRISLTDNIYCTVRLLDVVVDASGNPSTRTTIGLNNTQPVIGCMVIMATNQVNSSIYPTGAPFISYTQIDQALLINNITGLQAGQRYTLRIVAYN